MTKKITLTKAIGGHATGDTITVTDGVAEQLENTGHAEPAKTNTTKKPADKATD